MSLLRPSIAAHGQLQRMLPVALSGDELQDGAEQQSDNAENVEELFPFSKNDKILNDILESSSDGATANSTILDALDDVVAETVMAKRKRKCEQDEPPRMLL